MDGRRWRKSDPRIPDTLRDELVHELMAARRGVGAALKAGDAHAEQAARHRVHDSKLALGERGRAWWLPAESSALDLRLAAAVRTLLRKRGDAGSICPSEAARIVDGDDWRGLMARTLTVAWTLVDDGWLDITQGGEPVERPASGPVRLQRRIG